MIYYCLYLVGLEESKDSVKSLEFCDDPNYDPTKNILGVRLEREFFVSSMMVTKGEGHKTQNPIFYFFGKSRFN